MFQVGQIEDLEIHPSGAVLSERLNLLNDFIDGTRETICSKLAHFATNSPRTTLDLRFVFAHAENLSGREDYLVATSTDTLAGRSNPFELCGRLVQPVKWHVELLGESCG